MDDDLANEIARIEAELVQDAELRQQQQQQQPSTSAATPASMFGFSAAPSQPQSQPIQGGGFGVNSGSVNVALPQVQLQQSQLAPFQPLSSSTITGVASSEVSSLGASQSGSANPPPHHFSKDSDGRSIFVGNLPKGENGGVSTTSEELTSFFADCGQILNCTLLRDRVTHELKGTAYIEFTSYSAMGQAIDTKNNADYKGHTIIVC